MSKRVQKHRIIRKRVKSHMQELLTEDCKERNVADETHINDICCSKSNISNFIPSVETDGTNADNNCYLYEDNMDNLEICSDFDNTITVCDYSEEFDTDCDHKSTLDSDDNTQYSNSNTSLQSEIRKWSIEENIEQSALQKLLKILNTHVNANLPGDARIFLKTCRTVLVKKLGSSGDIHYNGIACNLQARKKFHGDTIQLTFNVDGMPIHKSSAKQLWPILCYVCDKQYQYEPFVVSLFLGESKPEPITEYFEDFILELKELCRNGFLHERTKIKFKVVIRAFICDTPARCMIKCCKLFNAHSGCDRCEQEGVYVNHRMTFPLQDALLRTDESFALMSDPDHHKSVSPLAELNIGLVSQFPLDKLHLVDLECTRKLLLMLLKGNLCVRLLAYSVNCISNDLIAQRPYFPIEFQRKPRSLKDIAHWKASEYRQFLLYSGILVLHDKVPSAIYKHFLLLHVAYTILCSTTLIVQYLDFASQLLKAFVNLWPYIYGANTVVYSIHCLTHLTVDAKKYGTLDSFSSYPFESYLYRLKKLLRTPNQPLQQIIKRLSESSNALGNENRKLLPDYTDKNKLHYHIVLNSAHFGGPLIHFPSHVQQFKKIKTTAFTLSTYSGNNCVTMQDNTIVVIHNFVKLDRDIYIIGLKYCQIEDFYNYPCSSSFLKIFKVTSLSKEYESWNLSSVFCKNVLLKRPSFAIRMFSVVDFPDEQTCEVVPTSWLMDENRKTFYPPYKGTRFGKAVTTLETPKQSWKIHSCRLVCKTDVLTIAKLKRDQYQYFDTDEIQGSDVTDLQASECLPAKRKCFPNRRYVPESASSDETCSSENNLESNKDRTYISKNKSKLRKKSKVLPEPGPVQYLPRDPCSSKQVENVNKENMRPFPSTIQVAAGVTTPTQSRQIRISEDKFMKIITMFEDIKYEISGIKRYLKNMNTANTSNIEEKLPAETEALIPALSLENLAMFNEHLEQKSVSDLYEKHLRRLGGTSQADHTRRVLKRLVRNELAKTLNWAGRGDKTSFQNFKAVCQLILSNQNINIYDS